MFPHLISTHTAPPIAILPETLFDALIPEPTFPESYEMLFNSKITELINDADNANLLVDFVQRKLPEERYNSALVGMMVMDWASRDIAAAGEWLQTLEPSPLKNTAMAAYADKIIKIDREAAEQWVNAISDQAFRESLKKKLLGETPR